MKILKRKTKSFFRSNKGETLIESLVSIFILSIFMLTITSIILVSMRVSSRAIDNAEIMQDEWFNPVFDDWSNPVLTHLDQAGGNIVVGDDVNMETITFSFSFEIVDTVDLEFEIEQDILLYQNNRMWAFSPTDGD